MKRLLIALTMMVAPATLADTLDARLEAAALRELMVTAEVAEHLSTRCKIAAKVDVETWNEDDACKRLRKLLPTYREQLDAVFPPGGEGISVDAIVVGKVTRDEVLTLNYHMDTITKNLSFITRLNNL